jgi:hypothetical protein
MSLHIHPAYNQHVIWHQITRTDTNFHRINKGCRTLMQYLWCDMQNFGLTFTLLCYCDVWLLHVIDTGFSFSLLEYDALVFFFELSNSYYWISSRYQTRNFLHRKYRTLARASVPPPPPNFNRLADFHEAWFPFHLRNFCFPKANITKRQFCEPERREQHSVCGPQILFGNRSSRLLLTYCFESKRTTRHPNKFSV